MSLNWYFETSLENSKSDMDFSMKSNNNVYQTREHFCDFLVNLKDILLLKETGKKN